MGFNPVTGDYSRGAAGLWIEGGELAGPVEEITIAGNLGEMLRDVDAVGSDLVWLGPRRLALAAHRAHDRRGGVNVGARDGRHAASRRSTSGRSAWWSRSARTRASSPGPGTNTYLVGTGPQRILLDTGEGRPAYLDVLERACARAGVTGLQEIVLTHGHPDHMGGVAGVLERFGPLRVSKLPWPGNDEAYDCELTPIGDGSRAAHAGRDAARACTRPATPRTISASCSRRKGRSSRATTCSASAPP